MKIEEGVMVLKDGKAWGCTYADGRSTCYGWMEIESAPIHNPKYFKKPTDATFIGSHLEKELSKGEVVHVLRTTTVEIKENKP